MPGVEAHLEPVKTAIRKHLIPALLGVKPAEVDNDLHQLLAHGVKFGGLSLRNPAGGANRLFQASSQVAAVLVASLLSNGDLDALVYKEQVRTAGAEARTEKTIAEAAAVKAMKVRASKKEIKRIDRIGKCGIWIGQMPHLPMRSILLIIGVYT